MDARLRRGALAYRPPVDTQAVNAGHRASTATATRDRAELHHAASEMGHPLHLYRQSADADAVPRRPVRLDQRERRQKAGIVDNDWVEAYNANGALVARAVVSQRVKHGMCMMYHAQEKIVNMPGSEITGQRGGIHNSVTRAVLKPTHMIGGYAQQSLRLQLLRHGRHQPRRVRHHPQAWTRSTGWTRPKPAPAAAKETAQ